MKKIVYLLLFVSTFSYSQNAFMEFQFSAKRGTESAILALTDDIWGDAEFKSGGINIESFNIGNEKSTHRIVLYGDPANWGRKDSLSTEDKWAVFGQKLNNHIEEWTHSSSGNVISWVGDNEDYNYVQIFEFKASNPIAFKANAKFVAKVDLPTPPLALDIAMVNFVPFIGFFVKLFGAVFPLKVSLKPTAFLSMRCILTCFYK